jgi:aspartate/glutamate racemase
MSRLGLLVGAGPSASAYFYSRVMIEVRKQIGYQPEVILYSLPLNIYNEKCHISGENDQTASFIEPFERAINYFRKNNVSTVAFPCFSLTPLFHELCLSNDIDLVNPFDSLGVVNSKAIGVLAVSTNSLFCNDIKKRTEKELFFPRNINEIRSAVFSIINGDKPRNHVEVIRTAENEFIQNGITDYIVACSELCLVDNKSKIAAINFLDVLIGGTVEYLKIANQRFHQIAGAEPL